MKRMSGSKRIVFVGTMLSPLVLLPAVSAGSHKKYPDKYAVVDMPASLALGTVRTPEFLAAAHWYDIVIQVEKSLPFQQMQCMTGTTTGPLESDNCNSADRSWEEVCSGSEIHQRWYSVERC
jgi:hypothetical protein